MNIEKLLEYQQKDIKKAKLISTFNESQEVKKYESCKKRVNDVNSNLQKLDKIGGNSVTKVTTLTEKLQSNIQEMKELKSTIENIKDIQGANFCEDKLNALYDKCKKLLKELNEFNKKTEDVVGLKKKTMKEMGDLKKTFPEAKKKRSDLYDQISPETKELEKEIKKLEKDIPKDLIKKYNDLKKNKVKFPIVGFDVKTKTCQGCFTLLSKGNAEKQAKLKDLGECPNCNRILYNIK